MMNNELATEEILLSGAPAAPGIAIGKANLYRRSRPTISGHEITNEEIDHQLRQFDRALTEAEQKLRELLNTQESEEAADLLQAQIEIINDPDLRKRVEIEISKHNQPADAAIDKVFGVYLDLMEGHQKDALQERFIDIADVRDRLIEIVNNEGKQEEVEQNTILVARNLSPREVIEFSEQNIRGIVMDHGGTTSHAAILAHSMQIPTVVGVENASSSISSNELIILNGNQGEVVVNPTAATRKKYDEMIIRTAEEQSEREKICEKPSQTSDGHPFILRANIEFKEELASVKRFRAEGIGLLRTESMYLRRNHFDVAERQQSFYCSILEGTNPHPVTIRLFDAGGDKFFDLGQQEHNPFLGWRGIRMLLDEKTLFEQQLHAILKTAAEYPGRVRILVPMVSAYEEVAAINNMMGKVQEQLSREENITDIEVQLGIMVEVPAVAIQADRFAEQVDFLSIGTNDLTQYMLAVDRGNERISGLYDQRHPSVWRMIQQVAEAGRTTDTPVSVCGELASDPYAACCLLGLGISELSMTPDALPNVKKMLGRYTVDEMKALAANVMESTTAADVNEVFTEFFKNE